MPIDRLPVRSMPVFIVTVLVCVCAPLRAHTAAAREAVPAIRNVLAYERLHVVRFVAEEKPGERLVALRAAIDSCIAMLEAKEYVAFLKRVIHPDDRERYAEKNGYEELAKEFAGEKADVLLRVLKYVRTRTPKFTESETVATFKLKKRMAPRGTIVFGAVDGVWYLNN